MKKKILLLDTDGVLIPKEKYFSTRYAEERGLSIDLLLPFFQNEFRLCQIGQADLKEELKKYIGKWQWDRSIDEFVSYWFVSEPDPSALALEMVDSLRQEGVKCYMATDQERYRAQYLWNTLRPSEHFDGAFFSCDVGEEKASNKYWEKVMVLLGKPHPESVVYIDDEEQNVRAALSQGIRAYPFQGLEQIRELLK